jgi:hypothetical protein
MSEFTVPDSAIEWDIDWSFDCGGSPGSFVVTVSSSYP